MSTYHDTTLVLVSVCSIWTVKCLIATCDTPALKWLNLNDDQISPALAPNVSTGRELGHSVDDLPLLTYLSL
jgi:hypothetical protein